MLIIIYNNNRFRNRLLIIVVYYWRKEEDNELFMFLIWEYKNSLPVVMIIYHLPRANHCLLPYHNRFSTRLGIIVVYYWRKERDNFERSMVQAFYLHPTKSCATLRILSQRKGMARWRPDNPGIRKSSSYHLRSCLRASCKT